MSAGVLGVVVVIGLTTGLGPAAHADSADEVSVRVPSSARSIWVDVDTDADVRAQLRVGAAWRDVTLRPTAFGYGAVVPASEGLLRARVVGPAVTDPDLSLTVVNETGTIVASATNRVTPTAAGTEPGGSDQPPTSTDPGGVDPAPGTVNPGGTSAGRQDGVASERQRRTDGALAFTGPTIGAAAAAFAVLSITAGLMIRRRQAARR